MRPSVDQLQRFYRHPLGRAVADLISDRIRLQWGPSRGMDCVGLGYAPPFMQVFDGCDPFALMPARQGGSLWPGTHDCRTALVRSSHLPFANGSVDRFLMVHALEHASRPDRLVREVWRVLKPGGQLCIIVPNRRRSWSALESTPYGTGQPWSLTQVTRSLEDHLFSLKHWETCLMLPPIVVPWIGPVMRATEMVAARTSKHLGGVLMLVAEKETMGTIGGHRRQPERVIATQTS